MRIAHWMLTALAVVLLVGPPAGAAELLTNGTFEGGFTTVAPHRIPVGWTLYETRGVPTENSLVYHVASFNGPSQPGTFCWEFYRDEPGLMTGDWTTIEQPLSIVVASYQSLTLSMDVMVLSHDLEAGGFVNPAFEWPAVVQIDYTDLTNNPQIWRYGWYLNPPGDFVQGQVVDPGQGLIPFYNDAVVPVQTWVTGSFNLLIELPQAKTIDRIRVGGSGWDFHSFFDNVSLNGILNPVSVETHSWGRVKALYR
jgi:hypothetical protein